MMLTSYTMDSDFGVFEAGGNAMLMRRVAEINALGKVQAVDSRQAQVLTLQNRPFEAL